VQDNLTKELINKKYGKKFQEHILEQYKLYVQTAENVSARRDSANRYFLSINTVLFSISGYLSLNNYEFWTILISVVGLLISIIWYIAILSYKNLNSGKFAVIHLLEKELPAKLFDYEWKFLEEGKTKKYNKLTVVEKNVPLIFSAMYLVVIISMIYTLL